MLAGSCCMDRIFAKKIECAFCRENRRCWGCRSLILLVSELYSCVHVDACQSHWAFISVDVFHLHLQNSEMGIYKKPRPFNHIFGGDRILRA